MEKCIHTNNIKMNDLNNAKFSDARTKLEFYVYMSLADKQSRGKFSQQSNWIVNSPY